MMNPIELLAWLTWDPPREAFTVPLLDRPIMWYGICFVLGFIAGYFVMIPIVSRKLKDSRPALSAIDVRNTSFWLVDRLTWYVLIGAIVGARLGHVFFYDWPIYRDNPLDIFKIWEGGLASHGGVIGIFIALFFYKRIVLKNFPEFTFLGLLDLLVVPTALAVCFIRIGNFFNQEILGTQTSLPWAVLFGHPADGSYPVPRHPAQLYEAISYFLTFIILYSLWKWQYDRLKPGILSGLFFILVFGSRFFIEFLKERQGLVLDESFLQTGQYLSLPFIALGVLLLSLNTKTSCCTIKRPR